jgi:hypothetical protein
MNIMDTVKTKTLIETTLTRAGDGESRNSPIRIITQYWTPEGEKVIERDPCAVSITPEKLEAIRLCIFSELKSCETPQDLWNKLNPLFS